MKNVPLPTYFGKNLKFLRRFNGLSQAKLGEQLKLNRSRIASYEQGNVEPSAAEFIKICQFFELSPEIMVDTQISNMPDQFIKATEDQTILEKNLINDNLNDFIYYTNEITKIKEGYDIFYKMKMSESDDPQDIHVLKQMEDILLILDKLIQANWALIQSIKGSE